MRITTNQSEFRGRLPQYLQTGGGTSTQRREQKGSLGQVSAELADNFIPSGASVTQLQLAKTAAVVREFVNKYEGQDIDPKGVEEVRKYLMKEMRKEFEAEYRAFIEKDASRTSNDTKIEMLTALREYVKALTSSLQAAEGWEDVAILHKRKSEKKGPDKRMDDEREKYSTIGHHTAEQWGTGSHHEMEKGGQVYGPATTGIDPELKEGGTHTWGTNAAWLLGHMHAGHRFIQVVPHTKDNLMRGSSGNEAEVGALAYEALKLKQSGYKKGRQEENAKLWTEYTPTQEALTETLETLARAKNESSPATVEQILKTYDLWANNIDVEDVIALDRSPEVKSAYTYVTQQPTWSDKQKGINDPYLVRKK